MLCPDWPWKLPISCPLYWLVFNLHNLKFLVLLKPMPLHIDSSAMCNLALTFRYRKPHLNRRHIFCTKRWNRFFAIYIVRLALYLCLKKLSMIWEFIMVDTTNTPLPLSLVILQYLWKFKIKIKKGTTLRPVGPFNSDSNGRLFK